MIPEDTIEKIKQLELIYEKCMNNTYLEDELEIRQLENYIKYLKRTISKI
jgi:radical SAM superfamily enzyme